MIKGILIKMVINPSLHYPCLFLVYLPTPLIKNALQTYDPNSVSDSMLMTSYYTRLIQPNSKSSKPCYKRKPKWISWKMYTTSYVLHLIGTNTLTTTSQSIYANPHSLNLLLVAFQSTHRTRFPT